MYACMRMGVLVRVLLSNEFLVVDIVGFDISTIEV